MNKIIINGKEIKCDGNNVQVINNKVYVDGKIISEEATKKSDIYVYGDVENIECEGSVECDNVKGNIKAGGSINCDNVGGDISCGGSVNCDEIRGNVNAGGSINR